MQLDRLIQLLFLSALVVFPSCSKDGNQPDAGTALKGKLIYPVTNELVVYSFADQTERKVFVDGYGYNVSADGKEFLWYDYSPFDDESTIQIHPFTDIQAYTTLTIPYAVEAAPQFVPGSETIGALVQSADDPLIRNDFHLLDRSGNRIALVRHVKDFAFTPDGQGLVMTAEALNSSGDVTGYALVKIDDFAVEGSFTPTIIRSFPDYNLLPEDLAVSPDGSRVVYTYNAHLYTIPLTVNAEHRQITNSRFAEVDAGWSPDGEYIVFGMNASAGVTDCSDIRIVPSNPPSPITLEPSGDEPVDPLQPTRKEGPVKTLHCCAVRTIHWLP